MRRGLRPRLIAAVLLGGGALAATPAKAAGADSYEIGVILSLSGNRGFLG